MIYLFPSLFANKYYIGEKSMHKTAMGRQIDMAALIAKNEKVRAVGNKKVNARGDTIDSHGRVIVANTERVNNAYHKTVGNKSAQVRSGPVPQKVKPKITEELSEVEKELTEALEQEDLEIERLKSKKNGN